MDRRSANDYRRRTFGDDDARLVAFVCECADDGCRRAVLLTAEQYDGVRDAGGTVLVDDTHLPPGRG